MRPGLPDGGQAAWKLLLACARRKPPPQLLESALRESIDWTLLLQSAERHHVLPWVAMHLGERSELPEEVRQALREKNADSARRSILLVSVTTKTLDLLEKNDIPAVTFKGPALSSRLYGNLGLRSSTDVDVLAGQESISRARKVLIDAGYSPVASMDEKSMALMLRFEAEMQFFSPEGALVEIQWRLANRYAAIDLDAAALIARARPATFAGVATRELAPADLLLVLCVHGSKHLWTRLMWLMDVAELLGEDPNLPWQEAYSRANEIGLSRMFLLGCGLAERLLSAPVPSPVLRDFSSDRAAQKLAATIETLLPDGIQPESNAYHRLYPQLRERMTDRLRYYAGVALFPTREEWQSSSGSVSALAARRFWHVLKKAAH